MEIPKTYSPAEIEDKWYQAWLDKGFFNSKPNPKKEPYTVVIPPPNVTGILHMGHMLNNTIQDVLVRRARMQGKEACWVPGTDHASIATETKVVQLLKEKGIEKKDLTREEFLKHAWDWKEKYGGIILEQLKKMGASCDWSRTRFTMEESLSEAVCQVFVDLYEKGQIYRGVRMVNWDPQGLTALSDEEVNYKQTNSRLYYLNYAIEGASNEFVTIATTRPETILADAAICVHPEDERYKHLHGKKALIPLINRAIPIIPDEYVDREFGTGCLKVTPAHDLNDYELGLKHKLPVIDILNDNGTLNEKAQLYIGQDRFAVRKQIAKDLEAAGQLAKVEDYLSNVGYSERTNAVVEPKLSLQWWLKMQKMAQPALENVLNDHIQLHPPKFKNMYRSWMENVRDWCISRQLWWGHRIPAYYVENEVFVARSAEAAAAKASEKLGRNVSVNELKQDDDVLDTWFSSWLWPISVFDGFKDPDNEDILYYYPTNDLVTAPEILFFWVARMIMAGYEYRGEAPFRNVYLTGIVRDAQGRKMSKSLGNSPDLLELMEKYGADGVRVGMLFSSPAGNDLLFDEKLCEQGRNFSNKIWNALRLVTGWEIKDEEEPGNKIAIEWFESAYNQALRQIDEHFTKFRISDALMVVYKLVWDDFCSSYLEMIKPAYQQPIDRATYDSTLQFFEQLIRLLHPFMPFITEEIWHTLKERGEKEYLVVDKWPTHGRAKTDVLNQMQVVMDAVVGIRGLRNSKNIAQTKAVEVVIKSEKPGNYNQYLPILSKLANLSSVTFSHETPEGASTILAGKDEFHVNLQGQIDPEAERERLQKELEYNKGFLASVEKKLQNERFVSGAPEAVLAKERQKQADAKAKIESLEKSLALLK